MADKFYPGQQVRVRATFIDPDTRDRVDPGSVTMMVRDPDEGEHLMTVTHPEAGTYIGKYVVNMSGRWYYRIESTDPGEAAMEGEFTVERSAFS